MCDMKRFLMYILGLIVLALGIAMQAKAGLGISPIVSVPYTVSLITGIPFSTLTFGYYLCIIVVELVLVGPKTFLPFQLIQVPMCGINSLAIGWWDSLLVSPQSMLGRFFLLLLAIVITGFGASLAVGMQFVPNPPDGLADALGRRLGKGFGFGKNLIDCLSVLTSIFLSIFLIGAIRAINIGTVLSMVLTGRVITLCMPFVNRVYRIVAVSKS